MIDVNKKIKMLLIFVCFSRSTIFAFQGTIIPNIIKILCKITII